MELPAVQAESSAEKPVRFWKNPSGWLQEHNLSKGYWIFFAAAFFLDAGFSVFAFLFNLYLLDLHFNERAMGLIGGAKILGALIGTLPAGVLARKIGLRPLLIVCFVAAPIMEIWRTLWIWMPAQIVLAFFSGLAICSWGVCFLPAIARLTTEKNRTAAFSLIFSVSIGTSALGGVICGYLPQWLLSVGMVMQPANVKKLILIVSCCIVMVGVVPVLRLRMPSLIPEETSPVTITRRWFQRWKLNPFLLQFLPTMALWSAVTAAFTPFANVYLSRDLHIPMTQIGLVFSTTQVIQLCLGLITPVVFSALGLVNGIVAAQVVTAVTLASLAGAKDGRLAVALYLCFSAAQWMSAPGLYNLLMTETPDKERSTASAWTMFCNALAGSAATAGAGIFFTRFGYPRVLLGISILALLIAVLFRLMVPPKDTQILAQQ